MKLRTALNLCRVQASLAAEELLYGIEAADSFPADAHSEREADAIWRMKQALMYGHVHLARITHAIDRAMQHEEDGGCKPTS
jgi:hypothetical protein